MTIIINDAAIQKFVTYLLFGGMIAFGWGTLSAMSEIGRICDSWWKEILLILAAFASFLVGGGGMFLMFISGHF